MGLFPKHATNATDAIGHEHDMEGAAALTVPANGGRTPTALAQVAAATHAELIQVLSSPAGRPNKLETARLGRGTYAHRSALFDFVFGLAPGYRRCPAANAN